MEGRQKEAGQYVQAFQKSWAGRGVSREKLVDRILRRPRLWTRLDPLIGALMPRNGRSEVEELERLYALPDPR